jgi:hypothetical protein
MRENIKKKYQDRLSPFRTVIGSWFFNEAPSDLLWRSQTVTSKSETPSRRGQTWNGRVPRLKVSG